MKLGAVQRRRWGLRGFYSRFYLVIFTAAVILSVAGLGTLMTVVLIDGLPYLDWQLLTSYDSSRPERAGILASLVGTLYVVGLTALFTAPLGVASAIFLEEFAPRNRLVNVIQINISNLAGVPSIVYGLLGFAIFVELLLGGQRGVLAGSLTLMLLVLPIVIITTQESLRAVPPSHRYAAYAMGATKWQVVKTIALPQAIPGIASGTILAYSRAIGEAAPIFVISSIITITFLPTALTDRFTVLPLNIFNLVSRPQEEFSNVASAGIIVLLVMLLMMNAVAIWVRSRTQRVRD